MFIIFAIYMLTVLFTLFLCTLFLYLVGRKIVLWRMQLRDGRYETYVYPKLSQFVTRDDHHQGYRMFQHARPWQRRIILRLLQEIAVNVQDEGEFDRIRKVCEWIGLPEQLQAQLDDKRWWIVAEALRTIGVLRLETFSSRVETLLHSDHYDVWMTAARTLARLGRNAVLIQFLIEHHQKLKREAVIRIADILRNISDSDTAFMLVHLEEVPPLLQGLFFDLFGQAKAIQALPLLESFLKSTNSELRVKAMKAIAEIGITTKQDEILAGFQSENWVERMQTIRIVRACSMTIAIPHLVKTLADPEWWVRYHAAETLFSFGTAGKAKLREAAHSHPDLYARDIAEQVLNNWSAQWREGIIV